MTGAWLGQQKCLLRNVTSPSPHVHIKSSGKKLRSTADVEKTVLLKKKLKLAILVICENLLTIMIISRIDFNNDYNMHKYEKSKLTIIFIFK